MGARPAGTSSYPARGQHPDRTMGISFLCGGSRGHRGTKWSHADRNVPLRRWTGTQRNVSAKTLAIGGDGRPRPGVRGDSDAPPAGLRPGSPEVGRFSADLVAPKRGRRRLSSSKRRRRKPQQPRRATSTIHGCLTDDDGPRYPRPATPKSPTEMAGEDHLVHDRERRFGSAECPERRRHPSPCPPPQRPRTEPTQSRGGRARRRRAATP
jgi:hypothetical protein